MSGIDLNKGVAHYVSKLEFQVKARRPMVAYSLVQEALGHFPDDPLIASYAGLLEIIMGNKPEKPLETCCDAVKNAKKAKFKKPIRANVYLNLGRAYLAAGKKKDAVYAFYDGLRLDRNNNDLYWEIKKLGVRRKPALPFLKRSNLINRLLGILLFRYLGFKGQTEYVESAEAADEKTVQKPTAATRIGGSSPGSTPAPDPLTDEGIQTAGNAPTMPDEHASDAPPPETPIETDEGKKD